MEDAQAHREPNLLSNSTAVAQILAAIPSEWVDSVLTSTCKHNQRERDLPSRLMIYFPILLGLFMQLPYGEVFRRLQNGFEWLGLETSEKLPSEAAMVKARQRLGFEPLKMLFERLIASTPTSDAPAARYRGLALTAIDGCVLDLENSKENAVFGFSRNEGGNGWYPQLRCVAVVNAYSRTLVDVEYGAVQGNCEQLLAEHVLARLKEGTLNLADRLYFSFKAWTIARSTGAHLLWRVKKDLKLTPCEILADGSYLSHVYEYDEGRHRTGNSTTVRVIEYKLTGGKETYRLVTTLLDCSRAPAEELARLYPIRYWTSEGFIREIKTVLRQPRILLRSKSPAMVAQELYGLFVAHHVVRLLMLEAAEKHGRAPAELSFTKTVYVVRRHLTESREFP